MITYLEALDLIRKEVRPLETESRLTAHCLGRVIAEDVPAPFDIPLFDNSAVDGFAVRSDMIASASEESPIELALGGRIRAGDAPMSLDEQAPKTTVQVLTGAPTPIGADAVVMQEDVERRNGVVRFSEPASSGLHIRKKGEEFRAGETVFERGTLVVPPVVAALAGMGLMHANVHRLPKVGIATTGNELANAGEALAPGQIFESNSFGIVAALKSYGIENVEVVHVKDERVATKNAFERLFETCDIVLSTGGISVGEFDTVKSALADLGVREVFWKIAVKPGKPLYFGVHGPSERKQYVLGLPGNPVSALVTFFLFAVPALRTLSGMSFSPQPESYALLKESLKKPAGRMEFVRGRLDQEADTLYASPIHARASHMLGSMGTAEALIHFPLEEEHLQAGQRVTVTPLRWGWI